MLTLNGQVMNVLNVPEFKDKKTGEITPARFRVQLLGTTLTQQGEEKIELVNLTVANGDDYKALQGSSVRVPVGVFVTGSSAQFYAIKGGKPEPVAAASPARGAAMGGGAGAAGCA